MIVKTGYFIQTPFLRRVSFLPRVDASSLLAAMPLHAWLALAWFVGKRSPFDLDHFMLEWHHDELTRILNRMSTSRALKRTGVTWDLRRIVPIESQLSSERWWLEREREREIQSVHRLMPRVLSGLVPLTIEEQTTRSATKGSMQFVRIAKNVPKATNMHNDDHESNAVWRHSITASRRYSTKF
jgi:hypothetical protein